MVHPHICGERSMNVSQAQITNGSSPRMWGKRAQRGDHIRRFRFIPTYVGKRNDPDRVYVSCVGSSPRAWGTRQQHPRGSGMVRFIPTRVGNATTSIRRRIRSAVHPHARGERSSIYQGVREIHSFPARCWTGLSSRCRGGLHHQQPAPEPFRRADAFEERPRE